MAKEAVAGTDDFVGPRRPWHVTLGRLLDKTARDYPSRIAITEVDSDRSCTYADLGERTNALAAALWEAGMRPHMRFGVLMHNSIEYLELVYAAAKIGATAVLVNRRLTESEMAYELQDSGCSGVVFSGRYTSQADFFRKQLPPETWFVVAPEEGREPPPSWATEYAEFLSGAGRLPEVEVDDECGWVIIYTSGTTGTPKGVVLSQANAVANVNIWRSDLWGRYPALLKPVVRCLVTTGLNHIGGLNSNAVPVLSSAGQVVLMDDFDPATALRAIERYRINYALSVGGLWNEIVAQDLSAYDTSSLELIGTSVIYHTVEQLRAMHEVLGAEIFYCFGQTETTNGFITSPRTSDLFSRPGTLGQVTGLFEVRLVKPDGTLAGVGEEGEAQYRGPTVFRGYHGRPDATADAFDDGWFRSGDVLRVDADGYYYFVDRVKDIIKSGGLNVFAFEVERVLLEHPGVADCAVVGLPDEKWGEAVTAFVVKREGETVAAEELIAYCRKHLGRYKVPKAVHFVDTIPVNTLGKKLKRQIVAQYTSS